MLNETFNVIFKHRDVGSDDKNAMSSLLKVVWRLCNVTTLQDCEQVNQKVTTISDSLIFLYNQQILWKTIWKYVNDVNGENHRKISFNIASEASYVYILSGQKLIKNAKKF